MNGSIGYGDQREIYSIIHKWRFLYRIWWPRMRFSEKELYQSRARRMCWMAMLVHLNAFLASNAAIATTPAVLYNQLLPQINFPPCMEPDGRLFACQIFIYLFVGKFFEVIQKIIGRNISLACLGRVNFLARSLIFTFNRFSSSVPALTSS